MNVEYFHGFMYAMHENTCPVSFTHSVGENTTNTFYAKRDVPPNLWRFSYMIKGNVNSKRNRM